MSFLSIANGVDSSLSNVSKILSKCNELESNWIGKVYDKFIMEHGVIETQVETLKSHISTYISVGGLIEKIKELDRQIALYDIEEDKSKIYFAYATRNAFIKQIISLLEGINGASSFGAEFRAISSGGSEGLVFSGIGVAENESASQETSIEETTNLSTGEYPVDKYGIVQKNDGLPRSGTAQEKQSFLFPNGRPRSDSEARKKIVTTEVDYLDSNGNRQKAKVNVHEALVEDVQEIFEKIADTGFKVKPSVYGNTKMIESYYYKKNGTSEHCLGAAIDINPGDNPFTSVSRDSKAGQKYNPNNNEYAITEEIANIFRSYGWSWGGADWTSNKNGTKYDYMHFDFTEIGPQHQSE